MSGADPRENLHDGRAVGFSTFGGDIFRGLQMGVKMILFTQFIFGVSLSFCVVNTTTEAWRTPPRFSGLVYSADRRRLTCVLNGTVNIV